MLEMLSIVDLRFLLMVLLGSVAGLFVGAIPGLSVSMATALLVSITYTWDHSDALAMIMGVYVVGVFSGAVFCYFDQYSWCAVFSCYYFGWLSYVYEGTVL